MPFENDATQAFLDDLPRINPGDRFKFACHPAVDCFNACCSNLTLILTPYDVLRLRRHLNMSSSEFMSRHGTLLVAPDTGFPLLHLRMADDAKRSCPFVTPAGCSVYGDRPGACRVYPLGRATTLDGDGKIVEQFFCIKEPHCHGFFEDKEWTTEEWFGDQGLKAYFRCNDRLMALQQRLRQRGQPISRKQTSLALLSLYQLDAFQTFIRQMGILAHVEVDEASQARILADEEAALDFGLSWLELALLGDTDALRPRA